MEGKRIDVLIAIASFFSFGFLASLGALVSELRSEQSNLGIVVLLSICVAVALVIGSGIYVNLIIVTKQNNNEP